MVIDSIEWASVVGADRPIQTGTGPVETSCQIWREFLDSLVQNAAPLDDCSF